MSGYAELKRKCNNSVNMKIQNILFAAQPINLSWFFKFKDGEDTFIQIRTIWGKTAGM